MLVLNHDDRSTLSYEVPMKILLRWLSVLPALLMLFLIFGFSSQNGAASGFLSYNISYMIVSLFDRILFLKLSEAKLFSTANDLQFLIRKLAHVTEYVLLTLSICLPLRIWLPYKGFSTTGKRFLHRVILPTFFLSLISAAADEFHQSFVPGRCGTPLDVLVDSLGIITGCLLLMLCHLYRQKKKSHQ